MKSMRAPSAAIFFMTYFHRTRGAMAPSAPPDPLLLLTPVAANKTCTVGKRPVRILLECFLVRSLVVTIPLEFYYFLLSI